MIILFFAKLSGGIIEPHFPSSVVQERPAVSIIRQELVEVAILDIGFQDFSGLTVLRRFKQVRPSLMCLVLTMHDNPQYVFLPWLTRPPAISPKERRQGNCTMLSGPFCPDLRW